MNWYKLNDHQQDFGFEYNSSETNIAIDGWEYNRWEVEFKNLVQLCNFGLNNAIASGMYLID